MQYVVISANKQQFPVLEMKNEVKSTHQSKYTFKRTYIWRRSKSGANIFSFSVYSSISLPYFILLHIEVIPFEGVIIIYITYLYFISLIDKGHIRIEH